MKLRKFNLVIVFIICNLLYIQAQETLNVVDSLGHKQGMWKEYRIPFNMVTEEVAIKIPDIKGQYYILTPEKHRKYFPIIECIGEYKDNLKVGTWKEYYSSGNIKSQIEYVHGTPFGECKMFWNNGVVKMECLISNEINIKIKAYDDDGNLMINKNTSKNELIKAIYEN